MARETGRVRFWIVLEEFRPRLEAIHLGICQWLHRGWGARSDFWYGIGRFVTDRTVVEFRLVICPEARQNKVCRGIPNIAPQPSDQILMNIMRKDRLEFLRTRPHRKRKSRHTSRPGRHMAAGTKRRPIPDEHASQAMTAKTGGVPRKVGNIWEFPSRRPICGRYLMA